MSSAPRPDSRVLVTGGAGFIGRHLVARLVDEKHEVVVLDSLETQVHDGRPPALPREVTFFEGNIGEPNLVDRALDGVDRIVHLAAMVGVGQSMYEIARYVEENALMTARFLEQVVRRPEPPRRLVVASSMSIYGEGEYECEEHGRLAPSPRPVSQFEARDWECRCPVCGRVVRPLGTREDKLLLPTSIYAITKRDHEEMCLVVGNAYSIPTVALRFFNAYGPGQALSNPYTGVAAIFASRLLNNRAPVIFEDGLQSRDFIHVSDIVQGIILALEKPDAIGRAINLGTGRPVTVRQVAQILADGLEIQAEPEVVGQFRAGDIRHCFADTALANKLLGFRAAVTIDEGMKDLVEWVSNQQPIDRTDQAMSELATRGLTR